MSSTNSLPPGVSQELYDSLPKGTKFFDDAAQTSNWNNAANWWNGLPGTLGTVVVPVSATLAGSFTGDSVMLLGDETVTVNGTLTSTDTNPCESFMVCDDALAVFTAGSALHVAGACIVGFDDAGTLVADAGATLTSLNGKLGRLDGGNGTMTIAGAHWTTVNDITVGLQGTGTLSITDNGVVHAGSFVNVAHNAGAAGEIDLSGGGTLAVGSNFCLGGPSSQPGGSGDATVTIGAGSTVNFGGNVVVYGTALLTLAGGTLQANAGAQGIHIFPDGTISGYGTISAGAGGITDQGTLCATGGTLMVESALAGSGAAVIGAGATLDVTGSSLGFVGVDFAGQDGVLDLATGAQDFGMISGFAAGDTIAMAGVNQVSFDSANGTLSLRENGTLVDRLHLSGSFSGGSFTVTQEGSMGVIGFQGH